MAYPKHRIPSARFYTTGDIAALLGVTRNTIWNYFRAGIIPGGIQLSPRTLLFERSEIDAWLAEKSANAADRRVAESEGNNARDD